MMSHKEAFVTSLFVNVSLVVKIPLSEFKISSNSLISRTYKKEIVVFENRYDYRNLEKINVIFLSR